MLRNLLTVLIFLWIYHPCFAQEEDVTMDGIVNLPNKFLNKVNNKVAALNKRLNKQTEKYVKRLLKEETKLRKQYSRVDSNAAHSLFLCNPEEKYRWYLSKSVSDTTRTEAVASQYLPYADSLRGSLVFIKEHSAAFSNIQNTDVLKSLGQFQQLEAKMNAEEQLRQFIVERKEQIKQYLSLQKIIPKKLQNIYQSYNQRLYYYSHQLQEFRNILNEPDKIFVTTLKILEKIPAFTSFMKSNSYLAAILTVSPDDYNMGGNSAEIDHRFPLEADHVISLQIDHPFSLDGSAD